MGEIDKKELKKHLFVSVLCGGGGKRLWPRSRQKSPKQFINLFGEKTVFEQTIQRSKKITTTDKLFTVTACDYVNNVLTQGQDLLLRNIVAEPMAKNTALAVSISAVYIMERDPEAVIVNLTSDHVISPDEAFVADMISAAEIASKTGQIVVVGIKPEHPHTGFGYIQVNGGISVGRKKAYQAVKFTEKPDLATAKKFIAAGSYYWNAGLYIWKAKTLLESLEKYSPQLYRLVMEFKQGMGRPNEAKLMRQIYERAENISIDYAVSEKTDNLLLLPASFTWDDIGDWDVVYRRSKKSEEGNAIIKYGRDGGYVVLDAKNNLIHFNDKLLALVGVSDLIVVDTNDALLICHRREAEKVKQIVKKIEKEGRLDYL